MCILINNNNYKENVLESKRDNTTNSDFMFVWSVANHTLCGRICFIEEEALFRELSKTISALNHPFCRCNITGSVNWVCRLTSRVISQLLYCPKTFFSGCRVEGGGE